MSKLYLLPVSLFVTFHVALIVSYVAAVLQEHVPPVMPYISDAATYHPESCVFAQIMNIAAVLMGFIFYIKYRQVLALYGYHPEIGPSLLKKNKLSLWFGMSASLGLSIVANFQLAFVPPVHLTGAFLCFCFGTVYLWTQTCISYMLQPMAGTKFRARLRLAMSISGTILYIVLMITGTIARFQFTGSNVHKCYVAAVLQEHVAPVVPYISDTGTYHPESCVFGQIMNIAAVLMGFTVYIKYRQVLALYGYHPEIGPSLLKKNKLSLWFGMTASLGLSIVANFQLAFVPLVHYMGAFLCFSFGTVYFWMQTCISYMLQPVAGTKLKACLRLAMSISCTILYIVLMITGTYARFQFTGTNFRKCYVAAVLQEHVAPVVPYISDTGTYYPESCVFGQIMNIAAVLSETACSLCANKRALDESFYILFEL